MYNQVVVIVIGGGRYTYKPGSSFETTEHWLKVNGTSRTPVAVFANHRVVRAYYTEADGSERDLAAQEVV